MTRVVKPPSRGRPPGAKNKLGRSVKENVVAVFARLGGTPAMAEWARDNPTEFYKIYARLIPVEASVALGGDYNNLVSILAGMPSAAAEALGDTRAQSLLLESTATRAE